MHIPTLEDRRFILVGAAVFAVVVLAVSKPSAAEEPAGTAFTYQGDLEERDTPVDGTVNFEFSLWDDPTDTDPEVWLGPMLSRTVYVEEGQFNVILDFGEDVFSGNARWLEIAMCSPSPCRDFITLTPRRELSTTAYALLVPGESENVQDQRTQQGQQGPPGTPGLARKFWTLKGNDGTTPGTNFLGTTDDEALELHVNGERALRLEPNATSPNLIGGYSGNTIESGAVGATIAGGGAASEENRVFYDYGTIGGGWNNQAGDDGGQTYKRGATVGGGQQNTASGLHSTVGGGHLNTASHDSATVGGGSSNTASFPGSTVGGGTSNTASSSQATVAGGYYNTASGSYSTVVGGIFNEATHESATVGGGHINSASNPYGTVGGGRYNTASGYDSTVGGGSYNEASNDSATIAGGQYNGASADWASIGGGWNNHATHNYATVGGGQQNSASGRASTVPGGRLNSAGGWYSFAAGRNAKADDDGMFVWADASQTLPPYPAYNGIDFPSPTEVNFTPAVNQFLARATGGVVFVSAVDIEGKTGDSTAGVELAAGGGSWSSLSSRDAKANIDKVDGREVLERLRHLPIATWNYKAQDESIRHIGPMAQDFAEAFGVGEKETMITTLDADGVALAAIQGLYEMVKDQQDRIDALEKRLAEFTAQGGE